MNFPKDFIINGIHCGISKKPGKRDLALFYSKRKAKAAGVFTSNLVKAAPVLVSMNNLKKSASDIRAVLANSGCANACTGKRGLSDAIAECEMTADLLGLNPANVLVASTGVIGQYLPIEKVRKGIDDLAEKIVDDKNEPDNAIEAIMTTDTRKKASSGSFSIGSKKINVWGCVKGAGMIHPELKGLPACRRGRHATMLCFILTDADISQNLLRAALEKSVEDTFNCVSVDGDTSTNDSVFVLANASAENQAITKKDKYYLKFEKALGSVCLGLAKQIARDGEGATHLVEIEVRNAKDKVSAKKIASTVATSPLVKTAIFGADANWGRILGACGRAGVAVDPRKIDVYFNNLKVCKNSEKTNYSEKLAKKILNREEIKIILDLKQGNKSARYFTCDLSLDYVKINADYRS
jgi:glutamate N-acetyltransferase / amino-acid N-acetyltransferase